MLVKLNEEGTTVIMVTHSRSHAEYARRIVNMLDGRVVTEHVGQRAGGEPVLSSYLAIALRHLAGAQALRRDQRSRARGRPCERAC